ncbi:hypothetical protein A0H81_10971 [Grifola frondosa]|uniref:Uncharacterized protein n=1 Tax=Grifola frondosa TaxID=5627 RepID=A0A1C7LWV2_GRIFR|nr:hypothetical protein A0H81_10971 [Grifola frondosa]
MATGKHVLHDLTAERAPSDAEKAGECIELLNLRYDYEDAVLLAPHFCPRRSPPYHERSAFQVLGHMQWDPVRLSGQASSCLLPTQQTISRQHNPHLDQCLGYQDGNIIYQAKFEINNPLL